MARPVQGQAPPWGNDLNGWLDVGHNADGTTRPPTSYLWAGSELTAQASGTYPVPGWVEGFMGAVALPASAGSDFAINGGDTTLIDVLTDSWISGGIFQANFGVDTGGDTLTFYEAGCGPTFAPFNGGLLWPTQFGAGTTETSDAGATASVSMPLIFCPAGSQITSFTGCYVSDPAHTWHVRAFLQLVKVA